MKSLGQGESPSFRLRLPRYMLGALVERAKKAEKAVSVVIREILEKALFGARG